MPDRDAANRLTLKNKIVVALVLTVVTWGILSSVLLERALLSIMTFEQLPAEVTESVARRFVTISTGLTILGICIFHLVAASFSRSITEPIKKLTDGVVSLARGDRRIRIDLASNDEFGQLADSFNHMVDELRTSTVSRNFLNGIIESMINTLMVISLDGRVQMVNQATRALLDYTEEELIGMPVQEVIVEQKIVGTILSELLRYSPICNVETSYRSRNGALIPVSFSSAAMVSADGEKIGIVCVAQDITEQRVAEDNLRRSRGELVQKHDELKGLFAQMEESRREWEATLDCVADLVILTDAEGRVRRFNRSVLNLSGVTQEELCGRNWRDIFCGESMDVNACYDMGMELYHRGSDRWFELKHYPFRQRPDSEESGMVITLHDTTEMKRVTGALEKAYVELKQSQTTILQQEKMASIGQLAAGVAHEINNPLGFIRCNLSMLEDYTSRLAGFITQMESLLVTSGCNEAVSQASTLRQEQDLDFIVCDARKLIAESLDGADRVRKIVLDLKSFSRADGEETVLADINLCLESAINIVWNEIKYKARLERQLAALPSIRCYPQRLNQVFMNLLVNAAQAIDREGVITLRSWQERGNIFIAISDTGKGIPAELQEHIFEPFFTTKEVGEGTGLGLSISYDIIKKHNGDISVASQSGNGTTFTVRLPAMTEAIG
jgi:two-component system NtrC family sensor kinase